MTIPTDVLEAEALSLPKADRSRLIDRLLASLGHEPEREAAGSEEADQREARIADRQAQWVNGPEAVARIRALAEVTYLPSCHRRLPSPAASSGCPTTKVTPRSARPSAPPRWLAAPRWRPHWSDELGCWTTCRAAPKAPPCSRQR